MLEHLEMSSICFRDLQIKQLCLSIKRTEELNPMMGCGEGTACFHTGLHLLPEVRASSPAVLWNPGIRTHVGDQGHASLAHWNREKRLEDVGRSLGKYRAMHSICDLRIETAYTTKIGLGSCSWYLRLLCNERMNMSLSFMILCWRGWSMLKNSCAHYNHLLSHWGARRRVASGYAWRAWPSPIPRTNDAEGTYTEGMCHTSKESLLAHPKLDSTVLRNRTKEQWPHCTVCWFVSESLPVWACPLAGTWPPQNGFWRTLCMLESVAATSTSIPPHVARLIQLRQLPLSVQHLPSRGLVNQFNLMGRGLCPQDCLWRHPWVLADTMLASLCLDFETWTSALCWSPRVEAMTTLS